MNDNTKALITTLDDMERVSKGIAASGMFGITRPEQAMTLMLICQAEGLNPIAALRRYHMIEGRPSMRADAMQGEFEAKGAAIIWHIRSDAMVAATAFTDRKSVDDKARERAVKRFELLLSLEGKTDETTRAGLYKEISKLSREGEETLIRTFEDAQKKGIAIAKDGKTIKANWATSTRQMLTARVVTELVRLLNPGLVAGIYTEDETVDIIQQEKEQTRLMLTNPSPRDREAIEKMMAQHMEDAEKATGERKKELLGLAAELRCALADFDVTPATPVETTVEPPAKAARAPRSSTKKEPVTLNEPADAAPTPWQEVEVHIGKSGGTMLGRKLGDLFKPERTKKNIDGLMDYFRSNVGELTAPNEKDATLWKAVQEAHAAWEFAQSPASAPKPATKPASAPEPTEPPPPFASVHGWRSYVIQSKNPDYNGKHLGTLSLDEIKMIETEYLSRIDWAKATLIQKSLKANIALALAELAKDFPPAANETPEHTSQLHEALKASKIDHTDFLTVSKENGWINENCKTVADVTEDEAHTILSDWNLAERAIQASYDQIPK